MLYQSQKWSPRSSLFAQTKTDYIGIVDSICLCMIFSFPAFSILKIGERTFRLEDLVVGLTAVTAGTGFLLHRRTLRLTSFSFLVLITLFLFAVASILSFTYTPDVLLQAKALLYWLIGFLPILVRNPYHLRPYGFSIRLIQLSAMIGSAFIIITKVLVDSSFFRSAGGFGDPNLAGQLITFSNIFATAMWLSNGDRIGFTAALISFSAILVTGSRESLVTWLVSLIVLLILGRKKPAFLRRALCILAVLSGIGYVVLINWAPDMIRRLVLTLTLGLSLPGPEAEGLNQVASNRITIWKEILEWVARNPLRPLGFEGLRSLGLSGLYSHNMFLQAWVIGGIFGVCVFLLLVSALLYRLNLLLKFDRSAPSMALFALFLGYASAGLVADHFFTYTLWNLAFFTVMRDLESNTFGVGEHYESGYSGGATYYNKWS